MPPVVAVPVISANVHDAHLRSSSSMEERIGGKEEHDPCGRDGVDASEHTEAGPDAGRGDTQHDLKEDDDFRGGVL